MHASKPKRCTMSVANKEAVDPYSARPALRLLGTEPWRAGLEFVEHLLSTPPLPVQGDGHPVVIFPGLASDGLAVRPLRNYCRTLGYAAFDWGQGFNTGPTGDVDGWLDELALHIKLLLKEHPQPPTLIGWSLGGIYARELAKRADLSVRQVITIGTPFNGTPQQTHAAWVYRVLSGAPAPDEAAWLLRLRHPPAVPTTSIFSRTDGIVAWEACLNGPVPGQVEDIEVEASHLGMGWNPRVLDIVRDRLAQSPGHWNPFGGNAPSGRRSGRGGLNTGIGKVAIKLPGASAL
jgi:pimeloyl-ACP methyl ester carboxylesterase